MQIDRDQNILLRIISDNWRAFKGAYPSYDNSYYNDVISSVLKCGRPEFGFRQYLCLNCGKDDRIVAFSCKNKFCLRCGRVKGEKFSHRIKDMLHPDVAYRHLILTIPEQTRLVFYGHRKDADLFNRFFKAGWSCVMDFVSKAIGVEVQCGCIVVLHTVGRDCEYKPHLHILLPAGGVDIKTGEWVELDKFPFRILHQSWKKHLLSMISDWDEVGKYHSLVGMLDKKYRKGFVARIEGGQLPKNSKGLLRYIAKYLCRPQMSLRRIKKYDEEKGEVEYIYRSHRSKKTERTRVSVLEFMGRMMQQILPKGFQVIRRFGLQASKNWERLKFVVARAVNSLYLPDDTSEQLETVPPLKYRDLVTIWWKKDPLSCRFCGETMELVRIWKSGKGFTFSLFRQLFGEDIGPPGQLPDFCSQIG